MQELMIEPQLWQLAAGWTIVGGIAGLLIGAVLQVLPGPRGGAALVAACVLGIFGAGAWYAEFVDLKTATANAELEKRGQALLTRTRAEDAKRPHAAIRISSESQREAATKVEATLKRNGVVSSGIEVIDPKAAPAAMEVRYFRTNDGRNADLLGRAIGGEPVHVPGFQSAPPNFFDIWFPKA